MKLLFSLIAPGAIALVGCTTVVPDSAPNQRSGISSSPSVTEQLSVIGVEGCRSVRAYTINSGEPYPRSNQCGVVDGRLNPKRLPKDGVELSPDRVARFLRAAAAKEHPGAHAMCFYPHHALVFFDAAGGILGHYTICLACLGEDHSVGRFVSEPDYGELAGLIRELGLPKP